jgi:hypothetical protein
MRGNVVFKLNVCRIFTLIFVFVCCCFNSCTLETLLGPAPDPVSSARQTTFSSGKVDLSVTTKCEQTEFHNLLRNDSSISSLYKIYIHLPYVCIPLCCMTFLINDSFLYTFSNNFGPPVGRP